MRRKAIETKKIVKGIFLNDTQLDYRMVPMLSQTLAYKSQCISKYLFLWKFLLKGIEQSALVIEMMIQKNLKALERMEVLIAFHMKVFHGNKCNSYTCTAQNGKVTSTRIVYEKSVMKWKVFRGVFRAHSNISNEVFLRK